MEFLAAGFPSLVSDCLGPKNHWARIITISLLFQYFSLKAKFRDLSLFVVVVVSIVPDLTISYSSQCGFDLFEDCHIESVFNGFILLWYGFHSSSNQLGKIVIDGGENTAGEGE